MATLLLIVIYIAFIGLGIPDSLFGTAWPAIYKEFSLSISNAGYVTFLISGCTMLSSFFCTRIINKFGTCFVTALSTALTAIALFGFSMSQNIFSLCIFAVPLGFGAGAVDAGLNNYVAIHYNASHMNFLHCFYGIGVTTSPYIMSIAISDISWRIGYRTTFYIQIVIALIVILSAPLWKKADNKIPLNNDIQPRSISLRRLAKMRKVRIVWLIFIASCSIEYILGIWSSTFLVETRGIIPQNAARIVMLYYAGIALGRFTSGIAVAKISSSMIIQICKYIIFSALLMLFVPCGEIVSAIILFIAGFGIGPVFPNMIYLTPYNFGKDISQSVIGSQMAASYMGIMLTPPFFGVLARILGIWIFPVFLVIFFSLMFLGIKLLGNIQNQEC